MFRESEQPDPSACPPWGLLLRHVVQAEGLTPEQQERAVDHIARCEDCANLYEAMCDADQALWEDACQAAGVPKPDVRPTRTVEEAFAQTWRRIEAEEAAQRRQRRRAMVFRLGSVAAAACILIALGVGWLTTGGGGSGRRWPGAWAERVTERGRRPLALNQPVATEAQPQEVLLGGMHRVVMNRNTQATFSAGPQRTDGPQAGKVPYEIQLAQGELYVEVVPGNPLTVRTANARLEITGTKFDVLADGEKTELTLLKGSVRFSALAHPQQSVSVTAGLASTVAGRQAPTTPAPVDALATTGWARSAALRNAVAQADGQGDGDPSALSAMGLDSWRDQAPADVDTLDYEKWREEHGRWGLALAVRGAVRRNRAVPGDWIEVLMISGDIWQFHYDPRLPAGQPLTKTEPLALARLARHCGLDVREMVQALGLPELAGAIASSDGTSSASVQTAGRRYAEALRRWHDALTAATHEQPEKGSDGLKLFSLYASQYLAETRTAVYLWAKNNPERARQLLADKEYLAMLPTLPVSAGDGSPDVNALLKHLRDQATAARNCVPAAMEWLLVPPGTGCAYQATEQQRHLAGLMTEFGWVDPEKGRQE